METQTKTSMVLNKIKTKFSLSRANSNANHKSPHGRDANETASALNINFGSSNSGLSPNSLSPGRDNSSKFNLMRSSQAGFVSQNKNATKPQNPMRSSRIGFLSKKLVQKQASQEEIDALFEQQQQAVQSTTAKIKSNLEDARTDSSHSNNSAAATSVVLIEDVSPISNEGGGRDDRIDMSSVPIEKIRGSAKPATNLGGVHRRTESSSTNKTNASATTPVIAPVVVPRSPLDGNRDHTATTPKKPMPKRTASVREQLTGALSVNALALSAAIETSFDMAQSDVMKPLHTAAVEHSYRKFTVANGLSRGSSAKNSLTSSQKEFQSSRSSVSSLATKSTIATVSAISSAVGSAVGFAKVPGDTIVFHPRSKGQKKVYEYFVAVWSNGLRIELGDLMMMLEVVKDNWVEVDDLVFSAISFWFEEFKAFLKTELACFKDHVIPWLTCTNESLPQCVCEQTLDTLMAELQICEKQIEEHDFILQYMVLQGSPNAIGTFDKLEKALVQYKDLIVQWLDDLATYLTPFIFKHCTEHQICLEWIRFFRAIVSYYDPTANHLIMMIRWMELEQFYGWRAEIIDSCENGGLQISLIPWGDARKATKSHFDLPTFFAARDWEAIAEVAKSSGLGEPSTDRLMSRLKLTKHERSAGGSKVVGSPTSFNNVSTPTSWSSDIGKPALIDPNNEAFNVNSKSGEEMYRKKKS